MNGRLDFFDTNLIVAASVPDHPHHPECHARLAKLRMAGGSCSTHSLAEAYGTLTNLGRYGFPPSIAFEIIEDVRDAFDIVTLTTKEYMAAIKAAAILGTKGPEIYDALLIACARKIGARRIYTKNVKHFRQVAPDLASSIVEP